MTTLSIEAQVHRNHLLNPLTFLVLILFNTVTILIAPPQYQYIAFFFAAVVYAMHERKRSVRGLALLFFALALVLSIGLVDEPNMWLRSVRLTGLILLRMMPVLLMALCVLSYSSGALLSAFRNVRFPEKYAISIAVFLRYFPEIFYRLAEIRRGAKLRRLNLSLRHPRRSFELVIVPLIYSSLNASDTLTCALLTKGVEADGRKTNYRDVRFGTLDVILMLFACALCGVSVWQKIF